ncbi:hypothetical protein CYY_006164 [Polysphondylium violaceum]|uniref:Uncharacterized protein n=1 Tax=Polysphondylium violaceum TaxID=133409 RepID=A0A8J4Q0Z0_9MYCE|nr:hypothetical protein CYY_006164 [Polysphondylium violaceum]
MSSLIDLDFETTTESPSPKVLPLGTESLISYESPKPTTKSKQNNNSNNNNSNNSNDNDLFSDLGIKDHTIQETSNAKPLSDSDIMKKFSSPPTKATI